MVILRYLAWAKCRGGEIGSHGGLKIPWSKDRAGSSPVPGTT